MLGCTRVSEGCRFCYAENQAARFAGPGQPFHGFADRERAGSKWTGKVGVAWHLIDLPLRWQRSRRVFVNSMSDLFHEAMPEGEIATVLAVAVAAVHLRGHVLQILTKRADRMCELLNSKDFWRQVNAEAAGHVIERTDPLNRRTDDARATLEDYGPDKPPPGIWLGVSVEDQRAANERIPVLAATPAAVRFLSCEPLIGEVDLSHIEHRHGCYDALDGFEDHNSVGEAIAWNAPIDWVICGGESGPGARPMHPAWARSLRDQCAAAGVPFFFKQWGEYHVPNAFDGREDLCKLTPFVRVGKKVAGRVLDGRTHDDMPRVA